jgi:hypothetical protein
MSRSMSAYMCATASAPSAPKDAPSRPANLDRAGVRAQSVCPVARAATLPSVVPGGFRLHGEKVAARYVTSTPERGRVLAWPRPGTDL